MNRISTEPYSGLISAQETGKLWDPNAASIWSGVARRDGDGYNKAMPPWPRSFAGDGHPPTLIVHLTLQVGALVALIIAVMRVREELSLHIVDVVCGLAIGAQALAVFTLVASSLMDVFVTDNILTTALTTWGYMVGMSFTTILVACSIRSDDEMSLGLGWSIAALFLEAAAVAMWVACVVNLCARGGRVFTQPGSKGDSRKLNESRAEADDFPK
jgi:hypothetical protein